MPYFYDDIVREFFEELKPLFINFLRKNFYIDYDSIMDLYSEVWLDVHKNIKEGNVRPHTKWKSYILRMGFNKACNQSRRRNDVTSIDENGFDMAEFERKATERSEEEESIFRDPELQAVLAAELGYIPDTCNKILRLYFFEEFKMSEIADMMNYNTSRSAITTMSRCLSNLRKRVKDTARRVGLIN